MKCLVSLVLAAIAVVGAAEPLPREERIAADAAAIEAMLEDAGGIDAIAERLATWREAIGATLDARPEPAGGKGFIAEDAPLRGEGDRLFSARRVEQLVHEVTPGGDELGRRRYALAEKALIRAHRELRSLGIDLLVVPVPDKNDIYPAELAPLGEEGVPTVHLRSKRLYLRLLRAGVEVVDCEAQLRAARADEPPPLYMLRDTHWSPAGARVVAAEVARRLRRYPEIPGEGYARVREDVTLKRGGDLQVNWRRTGAKPFPEEEHVFTGVETAKGRPLEVDHASPVLVLGDSYSVYPYDGHLSFWTHLAQLLDRPVAIADRAGGGNKVLEHFARLGKGRRGSIRVVVLLFTSCSFYEVDFPEIPLGGDPSGVREGERVATVALLDAPPAIDPEAVDYEDALAAVRAELDGETVVLKVPIMRGRRLLPAASWQAGASLRLRLGDAVPETRSSWQLLDDTGDFTSPVYYVQAVLDGSAVAGD